MTLHIYDEEAMSSNTFHDHAFFIASSIPVVAQVLEIVELNFLKFKHPKNFLSRDIHFVQMCRERK